MNTILLAVLAYLTLNVITYYTLNKLKVFGEIKTIKGLLVGLLFSFSILLLSFIIILLERLKRYYKDIIEILLLIIALIILLKVIKIEKSTPLYHIGSEASYQKNIDTTSAKLKNFKFPEVVYAQILLETGHLTSDLYKNYNNLFGMKYPTQRLTTAIPTSNGYAAYNSIESSIYDRLLWEFKYLSTAKTKEEYYNKLSSIYAEDTQYISKLKSLEHHYYKQQTF